MRVTCIDASDDCGTGSGLLTEGKEYTVLGVLGGYYTIRCDDGKIYTKLKRRFDG
jgi:hypothetical protein